ncbi:MULTISPECIES: DEAD/DEAH box helicase [Shewanella]|uniref:Type III restriction enzyme, res subunit n=1 Tax=Shewanella putrefaciens (strain CN-32 / ATCC BAA-453) TaxID=319224 RepID=A4YC67_SHEPC|nr:MULTISPECIES: DEAD/DEAH box helicase family protein [Shewanella]MCS6123990.1 DEAD/DEAH box helicase family protein [Shewanella baltica]QGS48115.1 DEAD/DEAH box helicase [Shewanella putrefaciens]
MKVANFTINDVLWCNLRKCQQDSITTALRYLRKPLEDDAKSCLISLPTGAGKSGVISVISHKAKQQKTLVLCHRRAVCDQLFAEISGKFFLERAEGEEIHLKSVFNEVDDTGANGIYVSTFQKLQSFTSAQLAILKQNIDLIIIDEGHAEPSPVWSTLVRGMGAHKIVITATPYRNDLFQFDINADDSFIYTFEKAKKDRVLKEPEFESINPQHLSVCIRAFLDENPGTKCIVKCNKFSDVETYYEQLNNDFNLLAIHDRYSGDKRDNAKSTVPANLKNTPYEVLIHQRKLDEGVDIPQAKLLVLTYPVSSGRELVQTVGRIVRVFGDIEPKVIELEHNSNNQMWQNYRRFDLSLNSAAAVKKFISSLNASKLIELYLEAFPDASYYGNRFLGKFDLNTFNPENSLNIPTASICFLYSMAGFSTELFSDVLYWRCNKDGELAKQFITPFGIRIVVSVAFNRSNFLKDEFFFEPSLEITLFKALSNGIVAIFDSRGRRFNQDKELKLGSAVSQDKLFKILSLGEKVTTKEMSSRVISRANKRPESIAVKSKSLDQMADMQANASYRLSTAKLSTYNRLNEISGSFYIGVDSGRISDQRESSFSLKDLNDWLQSMDDVLSSNAIVNNALINSFAKPIAVDTSLNIESVIFDLSKYQSPITISINGHISKLDNDFLYYNYNDGFLLVQDLEESRIRIELMVDEPYLCLISEEPILYSLDDGLEPEEIGAFLYEHLHKVLLDKGVGYAQGKFYQISLPVENAFDFANSNLANVVIGIPELLRAGLDEKGYLNGQYQVVDQEFSSDSVFFLLDKLKANGLPNPTRAELGPFAPYIPNVDLVLNTDMGTEPADFILSSASKLIYVHVKCGSTIAPQSAAGALAEVGSQAIKNLQMLISGNELLKPGNWNRLSTAWPTVGAAQLMHERIRLFDRQRFEAEDIQARERKLQEVWDVIVQRRLSSAVKKEIWIVAANSFSVDHFSAQLTLGTIANSETLQAFQLIISWISTAHANDVDLKIFVSKAHNN